MNKRREAAAILLAVLLFAGISHLLGQILMPVRKEYGSDWDHYLQEEQNSLDVLFFGSSLVYCDVIPAVIWRESGLRAYVMAGPEQTIPTSYSYIKEAFSTQQPKLIVLEATGMFYPEYTNYTKANIGYMPFGLPRLEATFRAAEREERFGLLFPLYNYHYRWQDVTLSDIRERLFPGQNPLAGYTLLTDSCPPPEVRFREYTADSDNYRRNLDYVARIRDLCAREGAQLLLYIAPSAGRIPTDVLDTLKTDMAALGVTLEDFNDSIPQLGLDDSRDWFDYLHFNLYGAEKFSVFLARRLEAYGFPVSDGQQALWQARLEHLQLQITS